MALPCEARPGQASHDQGAVPDAVTEMLELEDGELPTDPQLGSRAVMTNPDVQALYGVLQRQVRGSSTPE